MTVSEIKKHADKFGFCSAVGMLGREVRADIPMYPDFLSSPIDELNLSARAYNALKRARLDTIGQLADVMTEGDMLEKIRNLGCKSLSEIRRTFLNESYCRLPDAQKERLWQSLEGSI